jgi:hypothetical protein
LCETDGWKGKVAHPPMLEAITVAKKKNIIYNLKKYESFAGF